MSSDGTRKMTRTWDASPNRQTINLVDSDDVAIEEATSGPVAAAMAAPPPAPGDPRPRKNTLERFNDEMSLLDRPIEGEVEYFDEAPPPSRWKRAGLFVGIVAVVGIGGGFAMSHRHASASVAAAPAPAPAVAAAPVAPPPVVTPPEPVKADPTVLAAAAPAAAEAPVAEGPAEATAPDEGAEEDAVQPAPSSHGAWNKVKSAGHGKHARSTSGKSARSSKHVAGKHSSRHR